MRVLIIEDSKEFISRLKKDLFDFFSQSNDRVYIDIINSNFNNLEINYYYDFAFLDIDLVEANGISIAKYLKESNFCSYIIFVSSKNDLIHNSLIVHPYFFVRKSYYVEDLFLLFELIKESLNDRKLMNLQYKSKKFCVSANSIIYIETLDHTLYIHTIDCIYQDNRTLKEILFELPNKDFAQIHKSFVINFKYLNSYTSMQVLMITGIQLSLGRKYKNNFEKKYIEYLLK